MANFNFNKVILGGRLTADPELKQTQQGTPVVTFTVAINRRQKDSPADFITVQAWKERAEFVCRYFRRARTISIVGRLEQYSWTDKNGNKRDGMRVIAEEIGFVDGKQDETKRDDQYDDQSDPEDDLPF